MTEEQLPQPKKRLEKLFRLTPEGSDRIVRLAQYASMVGLIQHPSLQEFMEFAIHCADEVLKQHSHKATEPPPTQKARII